MSIESVKFGNLYAVNAIRNAQTNTKNQSLKANVADRELHPQVCSTQICETPRANILDLLA